MVPSFLVAVAMAAPAAGFRSNSILFLAPRRGFFLAGAWSPSRAAPCAPARFSRNAAETEPQTRPTPQDDSSYLWKLGIGSVGGAAAIKYGSILFPDITAPNIVQALLMVSLPVAAAVFILFKLSSTEG